MTKAQMEHYNMLNTVENHFNLNVPIWSGNAAVSNAKTALSAKIDQINEAASVQSEDSTGATMDKARLRIDLEKKGFFVSAALSAYTNLNPDQELQYKRLKITRSRFTKLREPDLLLAIEDLDAAATPIIASLEPYGVSQATLTGLMAARDAFHEIRTVPDEVTANRKNATSLIAQLLHEGVVLLEGRMDYVMEIFRDTQPAFMNVYFMERKIHRMGTRSRSLVVTTVNAADGSPLEGVQIEVVDHRIKRISSKKGKNWVQNLKEGNYTLLVSRENFVPQMVPFTVMNHQTTQVVVELKQVTEKQSFKVAENQRLEE